MCYNDPKTNDANDGAMICLIYAATPAVTCSQACERTGQQPMEGVLVAQHPPKAEFAQP